MDHMLWSSIGHFHSTERSAKRHVKLKYLRQNERYGYIYCKALHKKQNFAHITCRKASKAILIIIYSVLNRGRARNEKGLLC